MSIFGSENQTIMKILSIWGCETDYKYQIFFLLLIQKQLLLKKKARKNFFVLNFSHDVTYMKLKKILSNFAMTFSQRKPELELLELLPPDPLGPKDIPHRRRARPELAGALFRYINSLEILKSYLNLEDVYSSKQVITIN